MNIEDSSYPINLKNIFDPPKNLYCLGGFVESDKNAIAIVGTRRSSSYGEQIAFKFAKELALQGITIVSGLASGIDTCAHRGALSCGGRTIAVLAGGLDNIFPPENRVLAEEIVKNGCIISENPQGTPSLKYLFPKRNRIISGLSLGVVVIEAGYKSGAMITAKLALDQGREVFAVPADINSELSKGPHWLIKQGAKLVETIDDILEELALIKQNVSLKILPNLSSEENNIIGILSDAPLMIDDIAVMTDLKASKTAMILTSLELKGLIRQLPGKRFVLD